MYYFLKDLIGNVIGKSFAFSLLPLTFGGQYFYIHHIFRVTILYVLVLHNCYYHTTYGLTVGNGTYVTQNCSSRFTLNYTGVDFQTQAETTAQPRKARLPEQITKPERNKECSRQKSMQMHEGVKKKKKKRKKTKEKKKEKTRSELEKGFG